MNRRRFFEPDPFDAPGHDAPPAPFPWFIASWLALALAAAAWFSHALDAHDQATPLYLPTAACPMPTRGQVLQVVIAPDRAGKPAFTCRTITGRAGKEQV